MAIETAEAIIEAGKLGSVREEKYPIKSTAIITTS